MERKEQPKYKHVMVDLETLGCRAGCKVISIGAVEFNADGLGRRLYRVANTTEHQGDLHEDPDTLAWWEKQSEEARRVFDESCSVGIRLDLLLREFNGFLAPLGKGAVNVWGNGSDFDNAILYAAYAACGLEAGWEFWNSRCFRTLKNLVPHVKALERQGSHNALADAEFQAEHASRIFRLARDAGFEL